MKENQILAFCEASTSEYGLDGFWIPWALEGIGGEEVLIVLEGGDGGIGDGEGRGVLDGEVFGPIDGDFMEATVVTVDVDIIGAGFAAVSECGDEDGLGAIRGGVGGGFEDGLSDAVGVFEGVGTDVIGEGFVFPEGGGGVGGILVDGFVGSGLLVERDCEEWGEGEVEGAEEVLVELEEGGACGVEVVGVELRGVGIDVGGL